MNLRELIKVGTKILSNAGIDNSKNESKMLLCHVKGITNSELFLKWDEEACEDVEGEFLKLINERKNRRPIQHILKTQEFMGMEFYVDENVLIPRRETEEIVEIAIDIIKKKNEDVHVLDLCTGSGAIGVSVAKLTNAKVTCSDISKDAMMIAKQNGKRNFVSDKIAYINSDLFEKISKSFDVIISNPPYIESIEIGKLQSEVKDFEPIMALDGGEDGLCFYRRIVKDSYEHLNDGGFILLEIGYDQGKELIEMMISDGRYTNIKVVKDFSKNDRIVVAEKGEA
ncbi:MAG: peptide chain release factor N(5)-glutamine methyltransferase [Clostridiales bacterium]|jgi:release factor glutamine methyltransferase|nr:peptide chain release factor N(5)-glutamine methyltransferase [Clostridiales bacterium]